MIKQKLLLKILEPSIDDLPKVKSIDALVNKLDVYEATRWNSKGINRNSCNFHNKKPEICVPKSSKHFFHPQYH